MSSTFLPTPSVISPGAATGPYNNDGLNPKGSNYNASFTAEETKLIQAAIQHEIFDAVPKKYLATKLIMKRPMLEYGLDEFSYFERTFGRTAITEFAGDASGSTQTITLTGTFASEEDLPAVVGDVLTHPTSGQSCVVTSVTHSAVANSSQMGIAAQTGITLGTLAAGAVFAIQGPIIADGMDYFRHFDRMTTTERYNYIQLFQRNRRWARIELQKYINQGTTNYLMKEKTDQIEQLQTDLFVSIMSGTRGQFTWTAPGTGTQKAKAMGGLYPLMVAAGAQNSTVPLAGVRDAFKGLAFDTDHTSESEVRVIFGAPELLYELSALWKESGVRYAPDDHVADLNIMEYRLGEMRFIPVPCSLFRESSAFTSDWANRLIVVDPNSINPVKMKGIPHIEIGQTKNMQGGSRDNFTDWWVQANLSLQFNNPLAGFYINVI